MDDVIEEKVAGENRMPSMRKVLVVIPHFYGAGNGFYGSTGSDVSRRVSRVSRMRPMNWPIAMAANHPLKKLDRLAWNV